MNKPTNCPKTPQKCPKDILEAFPENPEIGCNMPRAGPGYWDRKYSDLAISYARFVIARRADLQLATVLGYAEALEE